MPLKNSLPGIARLACAAFLAVPALAGDPAPQTVTIGKTMPVVLDGKLDDWPKNATRIFLGRAADQAPRPGKWEGTTDLSGVLRMAWDGEFLYLAGDIIDDKALQARPDGAEPWEGDTLEMFFNIHPGPQRQGGFWQISLIPPLTPDAKFAVACPQGAFPDVEGAADVHPGGYTFECRIPWKNLAGFSPARNARLGIQFLLNDRDAERGRKSQLCWYPSAITFVHPTHMNLVELREEGQAAGADLLAGPPAMTVTDPRQAPVSILSTNIGALAARIGATCIPLQKVGANLVAGSGAIPLDGKSGSTVFPVELLDSKDKVIGHGEFQTDLIGERYVLARERYDAIKKRLDATVSADAETLAGLRFWHRRILALLNNEERPEAATAPAVEKMLVELGDMATALDRLDAGQDPYADQKGSFVRAYRSPLTGLFRPHALLLPPDYDPKKSYPLVVFLHGIFADDRALFWLSDQFKGCEAIVYQAASYLQFDWSDISAAETWTGLEDVLSKYSVDRNRISLVGWHNGGRGVLQLAMARPGTFSAIAALYPGIDTRPSYPALQRYPQYYQQAAAGVLIPFPHFKIPPPPEGISDPLERKILDQLSLATRAENIAGMRTRLTDGEADPDAAAEGLALTDRLSGLGAPVEVRRVPGAMHGNPPPEISSPDLFRWLIAQRRPPTPEDFTFVATNLRDNSAWGARIEALTSPAEPGRVCVKRLGGAVTITTSGVAALSPLTMWDGDKPVTITIDGQKLAPFPAGDIPGLTLVRDAAGQWKREALPPEAKRHGLSGPINDFQFDRFIVVYGSQGSEAAALEKVAKKLADRGLGAEFLIKPDRDVTPDDIASSHLVLIGTPQNNSLIQKISSSLPLKWEADGLQLGSDPGTGACMIFPSPLARERYVVVLTGSDEETVLEAWNQRAGVDYVVIQGSPESRLITRGLFDKDWKFSEALNLRPAEVRGK